jgi:hypothetical protein
MVLLSTLKCFATLVILGNSYIRLFDLSNTLTLIPLTREDSFNLVSGEIFLGILILIPELIFIPLRDLLKFLLNNKSCFTPKFEPAVLLAFKEGFTLSK